MNMNATPPWEQYKEHFLETDLDYLKRHYPRIVQTKQFLSESIPKHSLDILDIGAHWLHQTLTYALDGHRVTAADLPIALEQPSVKKIAELNRIELFSYDDLSQRSALESLQSDEFDVILFTEIIEHLTFNPIDMWKGMYRVLKPGGMIIVTTPNYYYIGQTVKRLLRMLRRLGGGITVEDILNKKTTGPHWKEYSARELDKYFQLLSRDFVVNKVRHMPGRFVEARPQTTTRKYIQLIETLIPLFRSGLYLEVALPKKEHGIGIEPVW